MGYHHPEEGSCSLYPCCRPPCPPSPPAIPPVFPPPCRDVCDYAAQVLSVTDCGDVVLLIRRQPRKWGCGKWR